MGQDRVSYRRDTTLIEASRILDAQFGAQGVHLTGAQVELLRNTMMVLNNPRTFVDEYHDGYYLTATDNDWDAIRAIVADLERKLMGNDNTMWGYNDRMFTRQDHIRLAPGAIVYSHDTVPAGEVWVITGLSIFTNEDNSHVDVLNYVEAVNYAITDRISPSANLWKTVTGLHVVLKEDDGIRTSWTGTVIDQRCLSNIWGYSMKVPD